MTVTVHALDEGDRIHDARGVSSESTSDVRLEALRGETVAFQIVVESPDEDLAGVTVDAAPLAGRRGVLPLDGYVEHFVSVAERSRNVHDPTSSLAWTPEARPPDAGLIGFVPDALIPFSLASCAGAERTFCPYPMHIERGRVAAVWFDVFVPEDTAPGAYSTRVAVAASGHSLGNVDVVLTVQTASLPAFPVSFFAYYSYETLKGRFRDPDSVERSLWQTLRAHHVDAFPAVTSVSDVERIHGGLTGAWFTRRNGYRGAAEGRPPEVVPIGAYGSLGDPRPDAVERARSLAEKLGTLGVDSFVYAADEECGSPRIEQWKEALGRDLHVGETCESDPGKEAADVVMVPANAFRSSEAARARAIGKRVFVYNGSLPFAGPLVIDAPLTSLTADGWIAASYDVDRWFFWETTFWNDDNRGGKGERDLFADAETFHNASGDASLGDGLLLYPATMPKWPEHSLEADDVLPSMRLKALRRGIEDAGLLALASSVDRDAALEVDRRIVAEALDEVDPTGPAKLALDPASLAKARADLRRIIANRNLQSSDADARRSLDDLRRARATRSGLPRRFGGAIIAACLAVLFAASLAFCRWAVARPLRQR